MTLCRQHCRLIFFCNIFFESDKYWQNQKQIQVTIWGWDEQACLTLCCVPSHCHQSRSTSAPPAPPGGQDEESDDTDDEDEESDDTDDEDEESDDADDEDEESDEDDDDDDNGDQMLVQPQTMMVIEDNWQDDMYQPKKLSLLGAAVNWDCLAVKIIATFSIDIAGRQNECNFWSLEDKSMKDHPKNITIIIIFILVLTRIPLARQKLAAPLCVKEVQPRRQEIWAE